MKEPQLTESFCEVLAGLVVLFLAVPLLDITHAQPLKTFLSMALSNLHLATLGSILVVAYLVGVIFDAVGLAVDDLFLADLLSVNVPTEVERKKFWCDVNEHVLKYRDHQWAWYSCYRNLFIILIPTAILWVWDIVLRTSILWGVLAAAGFVLLEIALVVTMKTLLGIYCELTRGV